MLESEGVGKRNLKLLEIENSVDMEIHFITPM